MSVDGQSKSVVVTHHDIEGPNIDDSNRYFEGCMVPIEHNIANDYSFHVVPRG